MVVARGLIETVVMLNIKLGDVVDRFVEVVPAAGNRADQYVQTISQSIQQQQLPVHLTREDASAGFMRGLRGKTREFLVAVPENPGLKDFSILHFGVPAGANLAVGWYLTESGRGQKNLLSVMHPISGAAASLSDRFRNLDLFDMADLNAILSSMHQFAVMEAVYAIAKQVGFDRERIDGRSVGFFGIG
jgi:hypothetical protein